MAPRTKVPGETIEAPAIEKTDDVRDMVRAMAAIGKRYAEQMLAGAPMNEHERNTVASLKSLAESLVELRKSV